MIYIRFWFEKRIPGVSERCNDEKADYNPQYEMEGHVSNERKIVFMCSRLTVDL